MQAAFYCVANAGHFPGLAGLVNSLRLAGHREPVLVLDCGLEPGQRERLEAEVTLLPAPQGLSPYLAKWVAPLLHPADAMVLVDVDVLVTRSLQPLLERVAAGSVVAVADKIDRFHPGWSELVGPISRGTYVNGGLLALPRDPGIDLLEQVRDCQGQVDLSRSKKGGRGTTPDYPFYQPDQDVWNAVFAARLGGSLQVLEHRLAPFPPFIGLRLVDEETLRCSYPDGAEPLVLHHVTEKPWLASTPWNLYAQLLRRVLLGEDAAIRVVPEEVPVRFRVHPLAPVDRHRAQAIARARAQRGRLGLRRRLASWTSRGGATTSVTPSAPADRSSSDAAGL